MVSVDFWISFDVFRILIKPLSLSTCAPLETWGFIGGAVQDPAWVYWVLGFDPSCKIWQEPCLDCHSETMSIILKCHATLRV